MGKKTSNGTLATPLGPVPPRLIADLLARCVAALANWTWPSGCNAPAAFQRWRRSGPGRPWSGAKWRFDPKHTRRLRQ